MLEVRDLYASFVGHLGELDALAGISFTLQRGEFVCLIGPSGCGKSTLLRIIAGLLPPSQGQVRIKGHPYTADVNIALVFQQPTLLPWRTVQDNIALPLELSDRITASTASDTIAQRTTELIKLVGLTGFEKEYPVHLSGGMAQRAAIARALAQRPELLLLDEPFGALDALTRERMATELLHIWQHEQGTVLMVTHNVEEAVLLADRVIVLSARPGRIVADLSIDLSRPRSLPGHGPALWRTPALQQVAFRLREALYRGEAETSNPITT
ncbi:MAG: ABC transporter ATP-binding protein [Anaerolineae bacterium]|nr:ABC transporter ATP-binding protein [Anaerolineae bacterium]